jgi:hypothetical protein
MAMPCISRRQVAALHRGNAGAAFLKLLGPPKARHPIQAFGFFLVVAPCAADARSPFMQWWMPVMCGAIIGITSSDRTRRLIFKLQVWGIGRDEVTDLCGAVQARTSKGDGMN